MYSYPYGDNQQLNLNWIINEIINLHKQLDPDYETPSFTQVYPYSNLNRLNLDWVLSELKTLKELAPTPTPTELDIQAVAEALVALPFDNTKSYQIYDYISRDGEIWRAIEPISAGGEWDETKWFKTKLGTDLAVLDRWINAINNSLSAEIEARQNTDITLQNRINKINHSVKTWDVSTSGKLLFIGNSYSKYDDENWNKFPYWCAQYLSLGAEDGNWYNAAQPSHCLAEGVIYNDLKRWTEAQTAEVKNSIGAVILVAGINDSRGQVSGESSPRYSQVPSRLAQLATYIKANLPNAVMYNGFCGWIDSVTRPGDDRTANYRMSVCKSYMEASKDGWHYLNGIEYIFHNKNYMADGVHPNENGAKRIGEAVANALTTGACSIVESTNTAPTTDGTVASNSQARERQHDGVITTLFNAFDFTFAEAKTFTMNQVITVGNIALKLSNFLDFGNQMFTVRDENNATHPLLGRLYVDASTGNINMQPKDFFTGESSMTIKRIVSFILTETHVAIND